MIKFENTEVLNMKNALRGMRNPMNSWDKNDSLCCGQMNCYNCIFDDNDELCDTNTVKDIVEIGPNDLKLCQNLIKAGTEHSKFMRQIFVSVDITAPLYWWKEFDTYKVGTVANSCSTMHKIHAKEFTFEDFSHDKLLYSMSSLEVLRHTVHKLNRARQQFIETNDKIYWYQLIQLLPSSYNQKRTVTLNYEVIKSIYRQRKNHKLDEWSVGFMNWIKTLPFAKELIMI